MRWVFGYDSWIYTFSNIYSLSTKQQLFLAVSKNIILAYWGMGSLHFYRISIVWLWKAFWYKFMVLLLWWWLPILQRSYMNTAYTEGFSVARMMFQNTGSHNQFRCLWLAKVSIIVVLYIWLKMSNLPKLACGVFWLLIYYIHCSVFMVMNCFLSWPFLVRDLGVPLAIPKIGLIGFC